MKKLMTISALALASVAGAAHAEINACLITKTDTNPFFVKMKEGATAAAEANGINLSTYAGKIDGDVESQVAAVETCIASGAKGILITPTDSRALTPVITQARDAGALVIALDTPLEPIDSKVKRFCRTEADRAWREAVRHSKICSAKGSGVCSKNLEFRL